VITTLGATGLPVTRIGVGLAALGRPAYINLGHAHDLAGDTDVGAMERAAHEVLDAAYAAGVRYFDAARSYGKAEAFLASWLAARGLGRDEVTVGSKWGYTYTADWRVDADVHEVKDLTAETLRRQLAETRELLGDHLRVYQIHSATVESGVLDDPEVREELAALRASGVAVGFSATGAGQAQTIEHALEVGGFDSVQATWNLLERSAGPALAAAHDAGLGVIVKEALANGRLTERGDIPRLKAAAGEIGCAPDALALAVVLAQPWVDVVLSGASTVGQLKSNLTALSLDPTAGLLAEFDDLVEEPESYWAQRSELPWS
jgi:aryl-alcohol dehydrogenase-like predicted oxidoreductase